VAHISRRVVLTGAVGATALGSAAFLLRPSAAEGATLTPTEAFQAAQAGDILFVDIRRPDEWARTGIAQGAVPIDMRRDDFTQTVIAARYAPTQPIALICARGVRSARVTRLLTEAGLSPIIDVPEGMLGSFAGPGWIKQGLPVYELENTNG